MRYSNDRLAYALYREYGIPEIEMWYASYYSFIENKSKYKKFYNMLRKEKLKVLL